MIEARALLAAGVAAGAGVVQAGAAGLGFLVTPIDVPLWFVLAAVALPTGDVLKVLRTRIPGYANTRSGKGT